MLLYIGPNTENPYLKEAYNSLNNSDKSYSFFHSLFEYRWLVSGGSPSHPQITGISKGPGPVNSFWYVGALDANTFVWIIISIPLTNILEYNSLAPYLDVNMLR